MPVVHARRSNSALLVALVPAVALVGGLPFVNRLEPLVLGLPFLLAWILGWVMVTPLFLGVAYRMAGTEAGTAEHASTEACATRGTEAGTAEHASTEACATRGTEAGTAEHASTEACATKNDGAAQ